MQIIVNRLVDARARARAAYPSYRWVYVYVASLAGTFDRRYTGDTHDSVGLREAVEGVAADHQADGEVSRRAQARSRERREKNRTEQSAAGITGRTSTGTAEKTQATARTSGRRG